MAQNMGKESISFWIIRLTRVILSKTCFKDKEFYLSPMDNIQGLLYKAAWRVEAPLLGKMARYTKENTAIIASTVEANISLPMVKLLKEIGKTVSEMATATSQMNLDRLEAINGIKVNQLGMNLDRIAFLFYKSLLALGGMYQNYNVVRK